MDPALLREREAFKKRAISQPVVEKQNKLKKKDGLSSSMQKKSSKQSTQSTKIKEPPNYKTMQGSSQFKFGILAKIVKHMKKRHLEGDNHPLTLHEILDETNMLDTSSKQRQWLAMEALVNNPKIEVMPNGETFKFKPTLNNVKDRKSLLRLLDKYDQRGIGGILLDDVQESLPNSEKALKIMGDSILMITRPTDKKKVLFYNDKSCQFRIDEDFQKLWRSVAVDGIDDGKIEEYLKKQGISSMQDLGLKKVMPQKRKKSNQKKSRNFKRHNDHIADVLEDYSNVP